MKENELKELIGKGHILVRAIFEMAGNPKEHVENTLKQYIDNVKQDPDYIFIREYTAPTQETEGIWSTFVEAEIVISNFDKLNFLCFNLSPANIEILQPESFSLTHKVMTDWYNDLLSKLHEVSAVVKSNGQENDLLKLNLNRSIRNCVMLALTESRNVDDVSLKVGIDKEHLQPFLDAMIKEKSIVLNDGKYSKK